MKMIAIPIPIPISTTNSKIFQSFFLPPMKEGKFKDEKLMVFFWESVSKRVDNDNLDRRDFFLPEECTCI